MYLVYGFGLFTALIFNGCWDVIVLAVPFNRYDVSGSLSLIKSFIYHRVYFLTKSAVAKTKCYNNTESYLKIRLNRANLKDLLKHLFITE